MSIVATLPLRWLFVVLSSVIGIVLLIGFYDEGRTETGNSSAINTIDI
jgi:hypothetical protein